MNTLFFASGYPIAIKICKDCVLESYETVKKIYNYITSKKLIYFEIGLSDDFVFQYLYSLKTQCPECILSCHGKLLHGNCILMSCSDRVRSRMASGQSLTPNIRRSLPVRLYVFINQSKKSKLRQGFNHFLITQLNKNLTLA